VAAVAALVYWYPVLAGLELSEQAWRQRMWFTSWI
jgi:dolichyl-phosphate-mannose--protein O-mannosyl transferase